VIVFIQIFQVMIRERSEIFTKQERHSLTNH